ncbi:MAG TPA: hypothetical protein DF637_03575 [Rikenellaceae bacterium]|nr:hypothetical protein [Rikenellaceae bacterium]
MIMTKRFIITIALLTVCYAGLFSQSAALLRMKRDVAVLAADSLKGREAGTTGEAKAARYIEREFLKADVTLLYPSPGQDFSIIAAEGDTLKSSNIIGVVEGWDPKLRDQYVLIGAHYDHLGTTVIKINGKDSLMIFAGADDNASGVAVMLEVARMVKESSMEFRRSVIFAAFGAEERGMTGSWYFANRAFAPVNDISLMINLDMVGRAAGRQNVSAYTVLPHAQLVTMLKDVADMPLMITPTIRTTDYFPSDHRVFATMGIPVVLFTTLLHRDYHTVRDTPEKLNYNVMEDLTHFTYNLVKVAANTQKPLEKTVFADQADVPEDDPEMVYSQNEVDRRAIYDKGDERVFLTKWVYHYLKYPAEAINEGIQGRVIVDFIIEKDGVVTNVTINKSADQLLDDEAVRVIKASPKWKAAMIGGKPVRSKISLPVEFRLKR